MHLYPTIPPPAKKKAKEEWHSTSLMALDETEKYNTLWNKGALIADRQEKGLELSSIS